MTIKITQNNDNILLSCNENKNVKLEFKSDGSNLNNEKLLIFLVKLSAQQDSNIELSYEKKTNEIMFIVDLLKTFNEQLNKEM